MNELRWRAGHLPGLAADAVAWQTLRFQAHGHRLEVKVPVLSEAQMRALTRHVREAARDNLHSMPVDVIIDCLGRTISRLLDPADALRQRADTLLPIVTGDDPELASLNLTAYLQAFRAPQLHQFVARDFPNPKVLDGFQPAVKGGAVHAVGPQLLVHSWAGNVPGLPLWSLASGLLVKAGSVGKLPSAEPVFASLFMQALAEVHPPLGQCVAAVWWKGGAEDAAAGTLLGQADAVLAYGGDAALRELREQVPVRTRFLGYGHKLGLALVGRAALDRLRGPMTARLAAQDLMRHEQQGCYSPHVIYVEQGGQLSPREFAQHLAAELANLQRRHPGRVLPLEEATATAAWRDAAEWRALAGGSSNGAALISAESAGWAVAYSDTLQPLSPTAGHRCVVVSATSSLEAVLPLLAPHAAHLQTVGLATTPEALYELAGQLGRVGVTRLAPLGGMTRPEAGWYHDGRFNLADLVSMVEIEPATERAADRLAPYWQEGLP